MALNNVVAQLRDGRICGSEDTRNCGLLPQGAVAELCHYDM